MSTEAAGRNNEPRYRRLLAILGGVAIAEILWIVANLVLGIRLQAPANDGSPAMDLGPVFVGLTAALLSLIAWGLIALLERLTARAARLWLALAPLLLLVSLAMPLSGSGVSTANRAILVLMHLGVGGLLIPAFYRTSPRRESRQSGSGTAFATAATR